MHFHCQPRNTLVGGECPPADEADHGQGEHRRHAADDPFEGVRVRRPPAVAPRRRFARFPLPVDAYVSSHAVHRTSRAEDAPTAAGNPSTTVTITNCVAPRSEEQPYELQTQLR